MKYLHEKCQSADSEFSGHKTDFLSLDEYSADIRYPGDAASEADAKDAILIATRLRAFIRAKLGLDQPTTPEGS